MEVMLMVSFLSWEVFKHGSVCGLFEKLERKERLVKDQFLKCSHKRIKIKQKNVC